MDEADRRGAERHEVTRLGSRWLSGPQVCALAGITYRQLDYWARTGTLEPALGHAQGSGCHRRYTRHQGAVAMVLGLLAAMGARQVVLAAVELGLEDVPVSEWGGFLMAWSDGEVSFAPDARGFRAAWVVDLDACRAALEGIPQPVSAAL